MKRFITMLLIGSVFCLPLSVCAKESSAKDLPSQEVVAEAQADTDEGIAPQADTDEGIDPQAVGKILATGTTTIYNGSGTLAVTLPSGNWWADVAAGIAYTERSGIVTCNVTTPDGDNISLGSISGSGSSTGTQRLTYAPAGTYYFYFSSAISTPYKVVAYIYD